MVDAPASTVSEARLAALQEAARRLGADFGSGTRAETLGASPADLAKAAEDIGLHAKALRLRWRDLTRLASGAVEGSVVAILMLRDGGAAILAGAAADGNALFLVEPLAARDSPPAPVDEVRLASYWDGGVVLIRRRRGSGADDAPFTLIWLAREVLRERQLFRDIGIASLVLSALILVPPIIWMTVVDRVLVYQSLPTLVLLAGGVAIAIIYETMISHSQRHLVMLSAARIDGRLQLHIFRRLLGLPVDYFERNPAGETSYRLGEIWRIREFLTGRLFRTGLDLITLLILLPVLFLLSATLTWVVLGCAVVMALIIAVFMPAIGRATQRLIEAETKKSSVMIESIAGMRTVKALALEPRRLEVWDERVAEATAARLALSRVGNWPQTLVLPFERFIYAGTLLVGAWLSVAGDSAITIGSLMAFAMIAGRVATPLSSLAQLLQEYGEVRGAIANVAHVLNRAPERAAGAVGARPQIMGAVSFSEVTFRYPGSQTTALQDLSFEAAAGTMVGIVGKSGSGKSTITRLLQGISTGYSGLVKIDSIELREIDLAHLRRSLGIVMQDNFLFRGTIRENITAGRPGLSFEDVVRAARLAGAEEFIERLPGGYDTYIEEGSPNLSGGQRQRVAIARALVTDPRVLILDEATSALDPESEAVVNANLQRIGRGRTMFIVSHRLSSLIDCDRIMVLDRGKLLDFAPHETLLERCLIYRQLWLQQTHASQPRNPSYVQPVAVPPAAQ